MEVTGQLKVKQATQVVSDKFKKRDFVLATDLSTPYPQFISFQVNQDKCEMIDKFEVGATIKVHFNLRGREYNNPTKGLQYFNTLEAWRIELVAQENVTPNTQSSVSVGAVNVTDNDDLPF